MPPLLLRPGGQAMPDDLAAPPPPPPDAGGGGWQQWTTVATAVLPASMLPVGPGADGTRLAVPWNLGATGGQVEVAVTAGPNGALATVWVREVGPDVSATPTSAVMDEDTAAVLWAISDAAQGLLPGTCPHEWVLYLTLRRTEESVSLDHVQLGLAAPPLKVVLKAEESPMAVLMAALPSPRCLPAGASLPLDGMRTELYGYQQVRPGERTMHP